MKSAQHETGKKHQDETQIKKQGTFGRGQKAVTMRQHGEAENRAVDMELNCVPVLESLRNRFCEKMF
jgi:DNA-binding protein